MKTKIGKANWLVVAAMVIAPLTLMSFETANGPVKEGAYKLSAENSKLNWKGMKPGGEHYGVVEGVTGSLDLDGNSITGGSFTFDMSTIVCHDLTNETFNKKLVDHLKSEDFFHVEKFPKAYFKVTSVVAAKSSKDGLSATHDVKGDLTIKGVTKEIAFPVSVKIDGNKVSAKSGDIVLDRTEWNVNHMSKKVFANLKDNFVNDEMVVSLDMQFMKK